MIINNIATVYYKKTAMSKRKEFACGEISSMIALKD